MKAIKKGSFLARLIEFTSYSKPATVCDLAIEIAWSLFVWWLAVLAVISPIWVIASFLAIHRLEISDLFQVLMASVAYIEFILVAAAVSVAIFFSTVKLCRLVWDSCYPMRAMCYKIQDKIKKTCTPIEWE